MVEDYCYYYCQLQPSHLVVLCSCDPAGRATGSYRQWYVKRLEDMVIVMVGKMMEGLGVANHVAMPHHQHHHHHLLMMWRWC